MRFSALPAPIIRGVLITVAVAVGLAAGLAWWFESVGPDDPDFGERFAALLQGLGVVFAAAGFFGIVHQIQVANRTLEAQLFDQTAGRMAQLNQMMLDQPAARSVLVGGRRNATEQQVEVLAEATIDYFDTELLRRCQFAELLGRFPDFQPWIVQSLRDQPPLGAFLSKRRDWYSDEIWAMYLRSGMRSDYEADLKRLVFVRHAPTDVVRPGERRDVPVPPMVVLGDILVHVHRNGQRTRAIVVGPPDGGVAAAWGIDCQYDATLPVGDPLHETLGSRAGGEAAREHLERLCRHAWRVLPSNSAWYRSLPAEILKDPRRPPTHLMETTLR